MQRQENNIADSNNITGKTDYFLLSAFLIGLEAYQIHQSR
jgi:hypothetical protein